MFTFPVCMFAGGGAPKKSLEFDGSTDSLSMSDANFGSYDRAKFAIAFSFRADSVGSTKYFYSQFASGNRAFGFELTFSGELRLRTSNDGSAIDGVFTSASSLISATTWYSVLIYFDSANATTGDRIRIWLNNSELTPAGYTAPSSSVFNSTADVFIGSFAVSSLVLDGLIYQPTFFSGSLPAPADVFDGTAGKLKNLSGLTGVHSSLDASTATNDVILSTDWTNNGTVTTSATIP